MAPRRPIVVVGGGLAALCVALACAPRRVVIVSASVNGEGTSSVLAQGGIAAALGPADTVAAHLVDTLEAGAGCNDAACVEKMVAAAPGAIAWLQQQGVAFDRDGDALALGREGGHRTHRIVHAGGDRTGAVVTHALLARARASAHVDWREGCTVDALLMRGGAACGVRCVHTDGRIEVLDACAVVLATGGIGGLFARSTNPPAHRGDGLALAAAAGARLRDLEYVQFHPTALAVDAERLPLVTEALRGAGAVLRDAHGRLAMAGLHPLGDLAPRDVVARRLWRLDREGGAFLDATALPAGWTERFPTVFALCRQHGIDPRVQPIPVAPAVHFHMGGIAVDAAGGTGVPGLFAVGEAACSGVHGANRLASNSLLECVVLGRCVGLRLSRATLSAGRTCSRVRVHAVDPALDAGPRAALRALMWDAAGPVRTLDRLRRAQQETAALPPARETGVAAAVLDAAASSRRSVGAHWIETAAPRLALAG